MTDERRRNIKMVYGSLAYDLDTLARERQLEEAGEMPQRTAQPERQPQPQTRRRPQAQAKARPSALTVGGIAAVCALVMVLLLGYVQLTAVSNNVSTIKKELATLEGEHVSHRHYSTGFYYGQPGQYYDNSRYIRDWQVVAVVESCDANGMATLSLRNKFRAGDTVEVVGPDCKPFSMVVPEMRDAEGFTLLEPRNPRMIFTMQLPRSVPAMSFVRHAVDLSARD